MALHAHTHLSVSQENPRNIVEAHIIDRPLSSDFYGQRISLALIGFLRPEHKFSTFDALIEQITYDVDVSRRLTKTADAAATLTSQVEQLSRLTETLSKIRSLGSAKLSSDIDSSIMKGWHSDLARGNQPDHWSYVAWK
jgi:hypothetical protein